MNRHSSKKYTALFISLFVQAWYAYLSLGCGGIEASDGFNGSLFAPEVIQEPEHYRFFKSVHTYYSNQQYTVPAGNTNYDVNIDAWYRFLDGKITKDLLGVLIYRCPPKLLGELLIHVKAGRNYPAADSLNVPYKELYTLYKEKKSLEILTYVYYARVCEAQNPKDIDWYHEDQAPDAVIDTTLAEKFNVLIQKSHEKFIAQRYLFQLIRLYFHSGEYDKGIEASKKYAKVMGWQLNEIYYQALGYVAACEYRLHNYSNANYLYAKIFSNSLTEKASAWWSFHPQYDSDWVNCQALAKDKKEQEALWLMYGLYDNNEETALNKIYHLNPRSASLHLLLMRRLSDYEQTHITIKDPNIDEDYYYYGDKPEETARHNDSGFFAYVTAVADKKNTRNPALWNLTAGYMCFLANDDVKAKKYFARINEGNADTLILRQKKLIEIIMKVDDQRTIDGTFESSILQDIQWVKSVTPGYLRKDEAFYELMYRLSEKYEEGSVKRLLCANSQELSLAEAESILTFSAQKNKTPFESFLLRNYRYDQAALHEYIGVCELYQHNYQKAIAHLKRDNKDAEGELQGDPFIIHNIDCHDCDHANGPKVKYTRLSFAQKMMKLLELAEKDEAHAAQHYFMLANGAYNMTWFGNARVLIETPVPDKKHTYDELEISAADNYYNCLPAKEYYLLAATHSKDREFIARCFFMASKCTLNHSYGTDEGSEKAEAETYALYCKLKHEFKNTRYLKEIIAECGYLADHDCTQ